MACKMRDLLESRLVNFARIFTFLQMEISHFSSPASVFSVQTWLLRNSGDNMDLIVVLVRGKYDLLSLIPKA